MNTTDSLIPLFSELISQLEKTQSAKPSDSAARIRVSQSISSFASIYEKLRNAVGYQQEQMLRRTAIERFLKRRIAAGQSVQEISHNIIRELIHAGYLQNDAIPEEKVGEVQIILEKSGALFGHLSREMQEFNLSIVSVEIERCLTSHEKDILVLQTFYRLVTNQLQLTESNQSALLLAALYEVFFKADHATLRYYLLELYLPEWKTATSEQSETLVSQYTEAAARIEELLNDPQKARYIQLAKKFYPMFLIIRTIVVKNPENFTDILKSQLLLEGHIEAITEQYKQESKVRLRRGIVNAVIFVIITKVFLGLVVEIPYDLYVATGIRYVPLAINLLFPPILMILSSFLIPIPGQENTQRLILLTKQVLYEEQSEVLKQLSGNPTTYRSETVNTILNILYIFTFAIIFGVLAMILKALEFNPVSGLLFFVFLSTISFLAFRIRKNVSDLVVIDREGKIVGIIDFLFLPFLKIGHWLSKKFKTANIFLFIFDFLLESPFKTLLEIIEQWIGFIKEKKEEVSL